MDRGGDGMTEDEAREILENNSITDEHPIVVGYPWWVTLRLPLLIMAAAFLVQGGALLALTLLQVNDSDAAEEQRELLECRNAYAVQVSESSALTRAAVARAQYLFNEGLIIIASDGDLGVLDIEGLREANDAIEVSATRDAAAIAEREKWEAAGQPLPCPVSLIDA